MLPPVFFSTAWGTEKLSRKEKRTLSLSQIETVGKNFLTKYFLGGWVCRAERIVLPIKAFIASILKYWSFLYYLIWLLQSNFSRKEKEDNSFATFWLHFVHSHGFDCASQRTFYLIGLVNDQVTVSGHLDIFTWRSRVRIPLKPWHFSDFFLPIALIGIFTAMITLHFHL